MPRDQFSNCVTKARLDGKVALVTGATSGLGLDVAKDFSQRGAKVIITGRNSEKLTAAKKTIIKSSGNTNIRTCYMDYESLKSVRNFSQDIIATEPRLDILVNNIGAYGLNDKLSADGLQLTMQVNYFGQFLLTFLLYPLLKLSAPSRVVNVASIVVYLGHVDLDHFNDVGRYNAVSSYSNSKLADLLMTMEMGKRVKGSGVSVFSLDPGAIKTNLFESIKDENWRYFMRNVMKTFGISSGRVARLPVYLAVEPNLEDASGKHFMNCDGYGFSFTNDKALIRRLWEKSKGIVGITDNEDWERHNS